MAHAVDDAGAASIGADVVPATAAITLIGDLVTKPVRVLMVTIREVVVGSARATVIRLSVSALSYWTRPAPATEDFLYGFFRMAAADEEPFMLTDARAALAWAHPQTDTDHHRPVVFGPSLPFVVLYEGFIFDPIFADA